jgi:hypothetical protein
MIQRPNSISQAQIKRALEIGLARHGSITDAVAEVLADELKKIWNELLKIDERLGKIKH